MDKYGFVFAFGLVVAISLLYNSFVLNTIILENPELESILSLSFWLIPCMILAVLNHYFKVEAKIGLIEVLTLVATVMIITRLTSAYTEIDYMGHIINFALNYILYIPVAIVGYMATWVFIKEVK